MASKYPQDVTCAHCNQPYTKEKAEDCCPRCGANITIEEELEAQRKAEAEELERRRASQPVVEIATPFLVPEPSEAPSEEIPSVRLSEEEKRYLARRANEMAFGDDTPKVQFRFRHFLGLVLLALLFLFGIGKLNNYLEQRTHTVRMKVVGFSWASEIDISIAGEEVTLDTLKLDGTGKVFRWPQVSADPNITIVDMRGYFYLHLTDGTTYYDPFPVNEEFWKELSFNDYVSVEVNTFDEIKSVSEFK